MENALSAQLFFLLAEVLPESLLHLWPEPRPLPQHHQHSRERATYERPLGNRQSTTFFFLLHPPLFLGMNHNANSAQHDRCSTPHPPIIAMHPIQKVAVPKKTNLALQMVHARGLFQGIQIPASYTQTICLSSPPTTAPSPDTPSDNTHMRRDAPGEIRHKIPLRIGNIPPHSTALSVSLRPQPSRPCYCPAGD